MLECAKPAGSQASDAEPTDVCRGVVSAKALAQAREPGVRLETRLAQSMRDPGRRV